MADGGSRHADTANSCPTGTASEGRLCDHAIRLWNWRALEPRDKGMVGVTLRYPYEVRQPEEYFDAIDDEKVPKVCWT